MLDTVLCESAASGVGPRDIVWQAVKAFDFHHYLTGFCSADNRQGMAH